MKAVMISIRPKWVEKIASGEKTVEVRKTVPKCGTPFKVYIYCTNDRKVTLNMANGQGFGNKGELYLNGNCYYPYTCGTLNGKVVGEFVCDYVDEFESEFVDDEYYESVALVEYDEDDGDRETIIMVDNEDEHYENRYPFKETCLSWEELKKYIGIGIKTFFGWHISDLKIYDKPKALSEFWTIKCNNRKKSCGECDYKPNYIKDIDRPPQSWCYVEEK